MLIAAVDAKEFHVTLLLIAIGGLFLLVSREWSVKIAGGFLLLARLWLGEMTEVEWVVLGTFALLAVLFFLVPRRFPSLLSSPLCEPQSGVQPGTPHPRGSAGDSP
jgi:hypothetical protein